MLQFQAPVGVPAGVQQYAVLAAAVTPPILPDDQIVVLYLDRLDRSLQDRARTDLRFRLGFGGEDAKGAFAQPRLVTFPIIHDPLVEVGEGATVPFLNQALEPMELLTESVSIEHGSLPGNLLRDPWPQMRGLSVAR